MRKRSWLDTLFLTAVLVVSACSAGLIGWPKATPPRPAAPVAYVPSKGRPLTVQGAAETFSVILAPVNGPSSVAVSQIGQYLKKPIED